MMLPGPEHELNYWHGIALSC